MLQPIITSGIKIKTTSDTSTPAITAAISPIPATMAATPKTFSPVRRTDLGYPRTTPLRGRLPAVRLPQHSDQHRPERPVIFAVDQELGEGSSRTSLAHLGAGRVGARWAGQNRRNVLKQLDTAIEGTAVDHVESNVGVLVVDLVQTGAPCDNRKRRAARRETTAPPASVDRTPLASPKQQGVHWAQTPPAGQPRAIRQSRG